MSKKKTNNSVKHKKHKKYNTIRKNNNNISKNKKTNIDNKENILKENQVNIVDDEEKIKENINISEENNSENISGIDNNLEETITEMADNTKSEDNIPTDEDIEIEKIVECNSLKSTEKKNFFILIFKLIGICIKNFFVSIYNTGKNVVLRINNFFEDKAEDIDRRIREIKDEQIIKDKKRKLEYEKYNSKRIYEDLERAEKYRNRASSRVNTEKYFEDKIEKERINNRILVNKAEEDAREAKEIKEKEKSINQFNESKRKSRIEKKKNEILELRKRKKEERQKLKDAKAKEIEKQNKKEALAKEEEEKIIKETEDIVKSLEEQLSLRKKDNDEDIYDNLFEEFGQEENLDDSDDFDDLPDLDDIIEKADKGEKIKNVNYKEKNENRLDEPYEKFEKENDIREVDEKLKSEILRLIDVPESETQEDFISEIEIPSTLRRNVVENTKNIIEDQEPVVEKEDEVKKEDKKEEKHKSYIDEFLEDHADIKTIGDVLPDDTEEIKQEENKNIEDNTEKVEKIEKKLDKESDPTVNIFAALRNANSKKNETAKNTNIDTNINTNTSTNSNFINSKVRVSDNQDGFESLKLRNEKNNGNFYDAEKLNVGTWKKQEDENNSLLDNGINDNKIEEKKEKGEEKEEFVEEYLRYKNPYEAYGKYIKNPEPEKKLEENNYYLNENVPVESNKDNTSKEEIDSKEINTGRRKAKLKTSEKNDKEDSKGKFGKLFKASQKKKLNYFDEDLYTNKFIKNIIDIDDTTPVQKKNAKAIQVIDKPIDDIDDTLNYSSFAYDNNYLLEEDRKQEEIEKEKYISDYISGKLDKYEEVSFEEKKEDLPKFEDSKVKILNVEEVGKDEIVLNAYVDPEKSITYQSNNNDINYNSSDIDVRTEEREPIHHFNLKEGTRKKVEERRERKISKNEEIERRAYDEFADDKMTFGDIIKDMVSGINSTISEIPENMKKKRESRNRIKRNQIYSTSHSRRRGRR